MQRDTSQILRYGLNGVVATSIHYAVLVSCIELLDIASIGLSNFFASLFGILFSFLGNKFFVFKALAGQIKTQMAIFFITYMLIALLHGLVLFIWSDVFRFNYNFGFILAVCIQFVLGYLASKWIVFGKMAQKY